MIHTNNTSLTLDVNQLSAALLELRCEVDSELQNTLPPVLGKPYPLGRCREIRDAVFSKLTTILQGNTPNNFMDLKRIMLQGAKMTKVWGDLRGEYFQNALKLENIYIDVANDTVVVDKPKIEILNWYEAGMKEISDFEHFIQIAKKYWQAEFYANTVFARIASIFPLVMVNAEDVVSLAVGNDFMINLARESKFYASQDIIKHLPATPSPIVAVLYQACGEEDNPLLVPLLDASNEIQQQIHKEQYLDDEFRNQCVAALLAVNSKKVSINTNCINDQMAQRSGD